MFLLKITQIIQITWMIEIIPNIDVNQKNPPKANLVRINWKDRNTNTNWIRWISKIKIGGRAVASRSFDLLKSMIHWYRWSDDLQWTTKIEKGNGERGWVIIIKFFDLLNWYILIYMVCWSKINVWKQVLHSSSDDLVCPNYKSKQG